jgi:hypothetical protein
MGYDITFHPITKEELSKYYLDILKYPNLMYERVNEITTSKKEFNNIINLLKIIVKNKEDLALINKEDFLYYEKFSTIISFGAAALAGFLHPYWYARNSCLTFLIENRHDNFKSYNKLNLDFFKPIIYYQSSISNEGNSLIYNNYSASGFIENSNLQKLKDNLSDEKFVDEILDTMGDDNYDSLIKAIDYAITNNTGLIEASDVYTPFESYTAFQNLRANFLNNKEAFIDSSRRILYKEVEI